MPYAVINKTGCVVRKGNCQIRLDFYLESTDPRYADKYLYLVDTTSPEYIAGYQGKVDKEDNPKDQVDYNKWWESLARVWVNTPFHSHFIYLPASFTQDDIKQAIELHLPNFYAAFQDRQDEVQGGMRHGWDIKTRKRPTNYSKTESPTEYNQRVAECQDAIDVLTEFQYKPDGKGKGETFPATEIDIGAAAINRASYSRIYYKGIVHTIVGKDNPANDTGTIDYGEIYLTASDNPDIWVGTFSASGNTLTCRDSHQVGNKAAGFQTVSGMDIDVSSGDYFGACAKTADGTTSIDMAVSGGGLWSYTGECIDPSDSKTFAFTASRAISLYGTGETVPVGWTGKISGVTNPAKIMGVSVANIAKVKGVA